MQIQGNRNEIINNILYGDVWLFSGQSNMEYQLKKIIHKSQSSGRLAVVKALPDVRMLIIHHVK